jgi:hypothetical protein
MFFARPFRVGYGNGNLDPPATLQQDRQPEPQPEQPEQPEQPYWRHARDDRSYESSAAAQEGRWDVAEREELQPAWDPKGAGASAGALLLQRGDSQRASARSRDGRAARVSRPFLKSLEKATGGGGGADTDEDDEDGADGSDDEDRSKEEASMREAAARVSTFGDAMEYCTLLLRQQVELAAQANAEANVAIKGDAFARRSAITLLTTQQMRQLFLRIVQDRNNWQRLRPLFGAPPYHFLAPEDAGLLRAAGLGHGRKNMAYQQSGAANYNQFGIAHLLDQHGREYRAVRGASASSGTIQTRPEENANQTVPYAPSALRAAQRVQFFCRLKKKRRSHRSKLLRDPARRAALSFPSVNEELVLTYSPELVHVWPPAAEAVAAASHVDSARDNAGDADGGGGPLLSEPTVSEHRVRVQSVHPRGARAATAVVVAARL